MTETNELVTIESKLKESSIFQVKEQVDSYEDVMQGILHHTEIDLRREIQLARRYFISYDNFEPRQYGHSIIDLFGEEILDVPYIHPYRIDSSGECAKITWYDIEVGKLTVADTATAQFIEGVFPEGDPHTQSRTFTRTNTITIRPEFILRNAKCPEDLSCEERNYRKIVVRKKWVINHRYQADLCKLDAVET